MGAKAVSDNLKKEILAFQKNEITEHHIYERLSRSMKDSHNRKVLSRISADEKRHYGIWKKYSGEDAGPSNAGTYELRMFKDAGYTRIATSLPFVVE